VTRGRQAATETASTDRIEETILADTREFLAVPEFMIEIDLEAHRSR